MIKYRENIGLGIHFFFTLTLIPQTTKAKNTQMELHQNKLMHREQPKNCIRNLTERQEETNIK